MEYRGQRCSLVAAIGGCDFGYRGALVAKKSWLGTSNLSGLGLFLCCPAAGHGFYRRGIYEVFVGGRPLPAVSAYRSSGDRGSWFGITMRTSLGRRAMGRDCLGVWRHGWGDDFVLAAKCTLCQRGIA